MSNRYILEDTKSRVDSIMSQHQYDQLGISIYKVQLQLQDQAVYFLQDRIHCIEYPLWQHIDLVNMSNDIFCINKYLRERYQ